MQRLPTGEQSLRLSISLLCQWLNEEGIAPHDITRYLADILFIRAKLTAVFTTVNAQVNLLSSTSQDVLIAAINGIRVNANPSGNLVPFVRDDTLVDLALAYAGNCTYGSSRRNRVAYSELNAVGIDLSIDEVVNLWADEQMLIKAFEPRFFELAKNYTAIVWKNSTKIGCAAVNCSSSTINGQRWYCLITPIGGFPGKVPYQPTCQPTTTVNCSQLLCGTYFNGCNNITCGPACSQVNASAVPAFSSSCATYIGCYKDNSTRDLKGLFYYSNDMTIEWCISYCADSNYTFAGLQSGQQCFCGNSYGSIGLADNANECEAQTCTGNPFEKCGGSFRNAIYNVSQCSSTVLQANARKRASCEIYKGCYRDDPRRSAMIGWSYYDVDISVSRCKAACVERGYSYAGLAARTCRCGGSEILSRQKVNNDQCFTCSGRVPCRGTPTAISVYEITSCPRSKPLALDWRNAGGVLTPIANQGSCGACWAFAAVQSIESSYAIATSSNAVPLSYQQALDCTGGTNSCNGGLPDDTLNYVISNRGLVTATRYPYRANKGTCQTSISTNGQAATISSVTIVPSGVSSLMEWVRKGPIIVGFYVQDSFKNYRGGIYGDTTCPSSPTWIGTRLNHVFNLVGYGTENGVDYWLVRNQWGTGWGDHGYAKIRRGPNICNIEMYGRYVYSP